jgi:hypothetical protein
MRVLFAVLVLGFVAGVGVAQADRVEPSLRDARAVCRLVAEGRAEFIDVPTGYAYGEPTPTIQLDVDNDGENDAVQILYGGTSNTPWVQANDEMLDSDFTDGEDSFGHWSGQIKLLRHRGRVYEVFYSDGATLDYPVFVGMYLPDNATRLVCSFESNAPPPRLRATEGHEAAAPICEAVARRGTSDYAAMSLDDQQVGSSYFERAAEPVDFMNDGRPRNVRRMLLASGSGAGCDTEFYALPGEVAPPEYRQQTSPEDAALAALQTTTPDNLHVRIGNGYGACHGNIARFHQINGSTVFEQRFPGDRPQLHDHEFWWVSRVENGQVVRLCEATEFQHRRSITYNSALYPQAR